MGMNLSVSSLGWDTDLDNSIVFESLLDNGICNIEIVLPKLLDWYRIDLAGAYQFINDANKKGISINSTQAILFNSNVVDFHHQDFVIHIEKVISVCSQLGISNLVLGAPNIRKQSADIGLLEKFTYIDILCKQSGLTLLIEPNSKIYNGKYFHTVSEIVEFIQLGRFTNISTMIDTHNIVLEEQSPDSVYESNSKFIKHIHVSEINLGDFNISKAHNKLAKVLKADKYENLIVYESKASDNFLDSIQSFAKIYGI